MVITQTPLRISFFGGGTDLPDYYLKHEGAVLSTTIDKYIYVIVKPRYDDSVVLNYSEKEIVSDISDIRHNILREALRLTGISRGIEITSIGDIPSQGSGLGSSSSFTVGLLNALYAYLGTPKNPGELAEAACKIEIEVLKEPIGKQDQYAAAFGGFKRYKFSRDGNVEVEAIGVNNAAILSLQRSCAMFYTGITRKAASVLSDQRSNMSRHIEELGALKELALSSEDILVKGDPEALGRKLNENWAAKRKMSSKISNPQMDTIYETAMQAGAYGGKLLGAGGGGFFFFAFPIAKASTIREALSGLKELPFSFTKCGSKVLMNIEESVYSLV